MPLRPRRSEPPPALELEGAICVQAFRPAPVAAMVERWERRPLDDPIVRAHPEFFLGLYRLESVDKAK